MSFDVHRIRQDFPILSQPQHGKPLVFLDSGASAQKPRAVIDAMTRCMETAYANVHRGAYRLSEVATDAYEASRGISAEMGIAVCRSKMHSISLELQATAASCSAGIS